MQSIKITIMGDFWDCQIYMGRLYLWLFDGSLKVYKWDEIVQSLIRKDDDILALFCAFMRGSYLYHQDLKLIFKDNDIKKILIKKLDSLRQREIILKLSDLDNFLYGEQDNPFDELPTDTEIINKILYGVTRSGVWETGTHRYNKNRPVYTRPLKLWDCPILSLKANKFNQIALSAGNEGLFELNPKITKRNYYTALEMVEHSIYKISSRHSLFSNYSYLSIYNSSNLENSFLALFNWHIHLEDHEKEYERRFERIIDEDKIFLSKNKNRLSWGSQEKIYRAIENGFEIVTFNNYADEDIEEEFFTNKKIISLNPWKGEVISGGIAYFGTILECENALVVVLSNSEILTIPGPITRWRVYPRSINYENHLHVILNDRIEIHSFNQDYFVDQKSKDYGIYYSPNKQRKSKSFQDDYNLIMQSF